MGQYLLVDIVYPADGEPTAAFLVSCIAKLHAVTYLPLLPALFRCSIDCCSPTVRNILQCPIGGVGLDKHGFGELSPVACQVLPR